MTAFDRDVFVLKLDTDGNFVWARRAGGVGEEIGNAIAVDAHGNVYTTGRYTSGDFDPDPVEEFVLTSAGGLDCFVWKLDSNGDFVWARGMGSGPSTDDEGLAIAVDTMGNVYTTGVFQGTADFDPGVGGFHLSAAGETDVFVSKLNTDGEFVWAAAMGGTAADEGRGVAVDAAGNVFITGVFAATADFNPGPAVHVLTSAGALDAFVVKLDANGELLWAGAMGGVDNDESNAIALDSESNVYTAGLFRQTADFDPGAGQVQRTSVGTTSAFISKLDTDGFFASAHAMGGGGFDIGNSIAIDGAGDIVTTGQFIFDFDAGILSPTLNSKGSFDVYVVKLLELDDANPLDINRDGVVDAIDVQLAINAALGLPIDPAFNADVSGDGMVNSVDIQLVINAALGSAQ
jgi:hypothetical protein